MPSTLQWMRFEPLAGAEMAQLVGEGGYALFNRQNPKKNKRKKNGLKKNKHPAGAVAVLVALGSPPVLSSEHEPVMVHADAVEASPIGALSPLKLSSRRAPRMHVLAFPSYESALS